jgi:hypothetical protein
MADLAISLGDRPPNGAEMNQRWNSMAAMAALGAVCAASLPAFGAAPDSIDVEPTVTPAPPLTVSLPADYKLDTEMVVRNWVICISRAFAEELALARATSSDAALATYNDLKAAKACGRFGEMRVILQTPVYDGPGASGGDALVFEALVNLAGSWASAYVVSGSPPTR